MIDDVNVGDNDDEPEMTAEEARAEIEAVRVRYGSVHEAYEAMDRGDTEMLTKLEKRAENRARRAQFSEGLDAGAPLTAFAVPDDAVFKLFAYGRTAEDPCGACGDPWLTHTVEGTGCGSFVRIVSDTVDWQGRPVEARGIVCKTCGRLQRPYATSRGWCVCPAVPVAAPAVESTPSVHCTCSTAPGEADYTRYADCPKHGGETAIADAVPCKGCGCAKSKHETGGCTGAGCGCGAFDEVGPLDTLAAVTEHVWSPPPPLGNVQFPWQGPEWFPMEPPDPKEVEEAKAAGLYRKAWETDVEADVCAVARLRAHRGQQPDGLGRCGKAAFEDELSDMSIAHVRDAYRRAHGIGWGKTTIGGMLRVAGAAVERGAAPPAVTAFSSAVAPAPVNGPSSAETPPAPSETVNHPSHYGGDQPYEVIKVLAAWNLAVPFCLGSAIKYIARAGKKDPKAVVEDLRKGRWYLDWVINKLECDQGEEE